MIRPTVVVGSLLAGSLLFAGCVFGELTVRVDATGGAGGAGGNASVGGGEPVPTCQDFVDATMFTPGCAPCAIGSGCCEAVADCMNDAACRAFHDCVQEKHAPQRRRYCEYLIPSGGQRYADAFGCLFDACRNDCFSANWTCADEYELERPVEDEGVVTFGLTAFAEGSYADFTARTCGVQDLNCTNPIAEATTAAGFIEVYLPVDFNFFGFVEFEHPDSLDVRFYPSPLWRSERVAAASPPRVTYDALLAGAGLSVDPLRGHVGIAISDCNNHPAAGVSFTLSGNVITEPLDSFYLDGVTPIFGATATTSTGQAFFANVPPGTVTYNGVDAESGNIVTRGTVEVRPDTFTIVIAHPLRIP